VQLHLPAAGPEPSVVGDSTATTMHGLRKRVILGFVIAPLAAPLAFDVMTGIESLGRSANPSLGVLGAVFLVGYMTPYAYLATLLIGVPAYLLLRRYGTLSLWEMLLVGAATSAVFVPADSGSMGRALLLFLPAGAASGLVLWLFVRRTPSESSPEPATR
jgi:hypothetical protein